MSNAWAVVVPGLAAVLAAWPILGNGLSGDDFLHVIELASVGPREFLVAPYGGHMLFVRNLAFYVCFLAFGVEPLGYFVVALVTHAGVAMLVGAAARRFTGDALVACLAGVLFAVAPTNQGTLGWYSAYGHALAAAAVLAALILVAPRDEASPLAVRTALVAGGVMLVASQCFGTGAGVAVAFPAIVVALRPATLRAPAGAVVVGTSGAVLLCWFVMNGVRTRLHPGGVESAVAMVHLAADPRQVLIVGFHLLGMGVASLLLGAPFSLARYGDAPSLAAVGAFSLAVLAVLLRGSRRTRGTVTALLVAAGASYLAVSAGRAVMYALVHGSKLFAALAEALRYHYLAQAVLAVVVAVTLAEGRRRLPHRTGLTAALVGVWIVWAFASSLVFAASTGAPSGSRERLLIATLRARLDEAILSQPRGATVCLPAEPVQIAYPAPSSAAVYLLYYPTDEIEGRRVRFVSSDPAVLALRDRGGRLQHLLVPEGQCPPASHPLTKPWSSR